MVLSLNLVNVFNANAFIADQLEKNEVICWHVAKEIVITFKYLDSLSS